MSQDIDDLIARLDSEPFRHDSQCEITAGCCRCYERMRHAAAAALRAQRDEIARLRDESLRVAGERMGDEAFIESITDRAERTEAERDALKSKVAVAEQAEALYCAQSRRLEECRTERDAAIKALMALWNLWNDPKWVRYKADYERGHLSYANMLDEAERPILPAIDAAMKAKP